MAIGNVPNSGPMAGKPEGIRVPRCELVLGSRLVASNLSASHRSNCHCRGAPVRGPSAWEAGRSAYNGLADRA